MRDPIAVGRADRHLRVALVGMLGRTEPDPDELPLLGALHRAGHDARVVAWDDPSADWRLFDVCLLRATWNYYHQPDRFLEWCGAASAVSLLLNPPAVVRSNIDKGYLLGLSNDHGIPIIPTCLVGPDGVDLGGADPIEAFTGWGDVVIKPAVSAGSHLTRRFSLGGPDGIDAAEAFMLEHAHRRLLIQPCLASFAAGGELCIVVIDGEVSHAVRKAARYHGDVERVEPAVITAEERRFAERVLDAAGAGGLLYARVDVLRDPGLGLVLSELELIEPSLFFESAEVPDGPLTRCVEGVRRRVCGG